MQDTKLHGLRDARYDRMQGVQGVGRVQVVKGLGYKGCDRYKIQRM